MLGVTGLTKVCRQSTRQPTASHAIPRGSDEQSSEPNTIKSLVGPSTLFHSLLVSSEPRGRTAVAVALPASFSCSPCNAPVAWCAVRTAGCGVESPQALRRHTVHCPPRRRNLGQSIAWGRTFSSCQNGTNNQKWIRPAYPVYSVQSGNGGVNLRIAPPATDRKETR